MRTQLQLLATTVALTVLIWVYADQSSHDTYQTTVLVRYVPPPEPDQPLLVRVRDGKGESKDALRVELSLRGPRSAIRRLEKDDEGGRFTLSVPLPDELKPGVQPLRDVYDDLSRLPEIRNRGIAIQSVHPREAQLEVDRYLNVPVTVEVAVGTFEKSLEGPPIVRPDKVMARVLESEIPGGSTLPPLRVSIEEALQNRTDLPGNQLSFDVPLKSAWSGINATFTPDHVRVAVRLAKRTTTERITLIPLGVRVEPIDNFFGRYEIEWQDQTGGHFTQTLNVLVPLEKAGQLKGNMIDAYVTIQDSDLPRELPGVTSAPATQESWIEREIRFVFPPNFEDVKTQGPPRTVKFRVKRRSDLLTPSTPTGLPVVPVPSP